MLKTKHIFLLLLLIIWGTKTIADELPDLGEKSETYLTPQVAKRLGKEFMEKVRLSVPMVEDIIINSYIQSLGDKLVSYANSKRKNFHFFVVKDSTINAFAGPDAHIGINTGTITAVNSEDELAAIMAHEIAHVTKHHIERLIYNMKNVQLVAAAGILAAIIVGSTIKEGSQQKTAVSEPPGAIPNSSAGDLATGAAIASVGGATQYMINFTREHEIEADNIGIKILANASINPKVMPEVFERIQRLHYDYVSTTPKFLLTHPVTSDRIAEARNRAESYPLVTTKPQNTFDLIRARTLVLTNNNYPNAIKNWQLQLKQHKNSVGLQYGLALTLYKNMRYTEATTIVTSLQKDYPSEVLFSLLAAELAVANKQPLEAVSILKTALTTHKEYYPLMIQYGETLITANHPDLACRFIKRKLIHHPNDAALNRLLAKAYAANHQIADAYQAKAKAYAIEGYNRQAVLLLQQALKTPNLNTTESFHEILFQRIGNLKKPGFFAGS